MYLATSLREKLEGEFNTSTGPDGSAWASYTPGSIRRGRRPPVSLVESFRMLNSMTVSPTGQGVYVQFASPAGHHHYGTRNMEARRIVPDGEGEIDDLIEAAMDRAFEESGIPEIDRHFQ